MNVKTIEKILNDVFNDNALNVIQYTSEKLINAVHDQDNMALRVNLKISDNDSVASSDTEGTFRYLTTANSSSLDFCMKVGEGSYEWVNIQTINW